MLVVLALSIAVANAPSSEFAACMQRAGQVSADMLSCGSEEVRRIDGRMNRAYRLLMTRLPRAEQRRLRTEQRAWLKHHVTEVDRLAADPNEGSIAFLQSQNFELQDLGERTALLEKKVAALR